MKDRPQEALTWAELPDFIRIRSHRSDVDLYWEDVGWWRARPDDDGTVVEVLREEHGLLCWCFVAVV